MFFLAEKYLGMTMTMTFNKESDTHCMKFVMSYLRMNDPKRYPKLDSEAFP